MSSILLILLIFVIWIRYENSKSNRLAHKAKDDFWKTEREANLTRKQDISSLDYIKIPIDQLPYIDTSDSDLISYQDDMKNLSEKKILNLSRFTNTWLKQQYGPSNFEALSSYDENYTRLIKTISNWGKCLYEKNYINEARTVLEYGIQCKTDIKNNYIILGQIYKEQFDIDALNRLIESANVLNTLMKSSILSSLNQIKNK